MSAIRHRPWLADAAIAAAILITGIAVGASYRRVSFAAGRLEVFGQTEFGAAVSLTCGHGFVDPGYGSMPALDDFLHLKRDRLSCSDLLASFPPQQPNLTQGLYRYLMMAASLVWRISGISWSGLTPLFGVLYGLTLVAAYGVFRLLVGRVTAVAATLALMVSAVHLQSLPQLRDYAKAPFILALILIMGLIARPPLRPRRAIALALVFGATLGIGFGFRNDLLINVLPWIAVVLFCLPGSIRESIRLKLACLAVSAVAFAILAWPILAAYSRGSNSGHVALLGLMDPFDGPLGVDPSIYSWGYTYLDEYAAAVINSFAYRVYGHGVPFLSAEYDRAMVTYVLEIVRHWPADMITRMYASVIKVIEFPFFVDAYASGTPDGITHAGVQMFYGYENVALKALKSWSVISVALALAFLGAGSVRAALTLLLFLVYFAGYPALQFNVRHFFHLEFIAWAALAFLVDRLASIAVHLWRARRDVLRSDTWVDARRASARMARNLVVVAGVAAILIVAPVTILRAYQGNHLRTMFSQQYLGARREPIAFVATGVAGNATAITMPTLWQARDPKRKVSTEYLAIEVSPKTCDALYVQLAFKYEGYAGGFDHSVDVPLIDGDKPTLVFSPVYYTQSGRFSRIEVAERDAPCVARISRIAQSEIPDVPVDANFTPHWQDGVLFQTIRELETMDRGERLPNLYRDPAFGPAPQRTPPQPFIVPTDAPQLLAPIGKWQSDGTFVIKGRPAAPESTITTIRGQALEAGSVLICRGIVRHGGVTVGALLNDRWAKSANVAAPGPFAVALTLDTTGTYTVVLANFAHSGNNDVIISSLGWLPPAGK